MCTCTQYHVLVMRYSSVFSRYLPVQLGICSATDHCPRAAFTSDLMKKKQEHMKMTWRVQPSHKRLQARMEQMRKFRRQHEQLRTVIVRVLRPAVQRPAAADQAAVTGGAGTGETQPQPLSLDAADANAIEVRHARYGGAGREGVRGWRN